MSRKKILIVGSGGREHALAWKFIQSPEIERVFCADGNAGIAAISECIPLKPHEIGALADFAQREAISLTFTGGENALALGITDEFEARGLRIIGPSKKAAQLEASKSFAKAFMARHGIPTAKYFAASSIAEAKGHLAEFPGGVVVKADGLAAGKGVAVCEGGEEAKRAIDGLSATISAEAMASIILEERLYGKEVSVLLFSDGKDFALMPPVRDHKRIGEGDSGPNTGGMGTFSDDALLSEGQIRVISDEIITPTLKGCISDGFPFKGILFLGIMLTEEGPKVLEYNVRFGDPETQSIMIRLESDLLEICEAIADGRLAEIDIKWKRGSSACVVLAAENYPDKPRTGDKIEGLGEVKDAVIFHAGTSKDAAGNFITAGGRVLGITAIADNLEGALAKAYESVGRISWPGMQYRRDIGKTL